MLRARSLPKELMYILHIKDFKSQISFLKCVRKLIIRKGNQRQTPGFSLKVNQLHPEKYTLWKLIARNMTFQNLLSVVVKGIKNMECNKKKKLFWAPYHGSFNQGKFKGLDIITCRLCQVFHQPGSPLDLQECSVLVSSVSLYWQDLNQDKIYCF